MQLANKFTVPSKVNAATTSHDEDFDRVLPMLKSALALGEEDFGFRVPPMPTNLGKRRARQKKYLLSFEQVGQLLAYTQSDHEHSTYLTRPFLAGTRTGQRLSLLWEDVADAPANHLELDAPTPALAWRTVLRRFGPGRLQPWPLPRKGGGGAMNYHSLLKRPWKSVIKKLDLPYASHHAAGHMFVSVPQNWSHLQMTLPPAMPARSSAIKLSA